MKRARSLQASKRVPVGCVIVRAHGTDVTRREDGAAVEPRRLMDARDAKHGAIRARPVSKRDPRDAE